jgi:hypothetical protein
MAEEFLYAVKIGSLWTFNETKKNKNGGKSTINYFIAVYNTGVSFTTIATL